MALQRDTHYPGRYSTGDAAHPQGAFKNRTTPTSQDGSYLEKDWLNDWDGFFASLLDETGMTPDGNIDAVGASQYFSALQSITKGTYVTELNGYQKLPSGLIIQWGYGLSDTDGRENTFPITFPNDCFVIVGVTSNPTSNYPVATVKTSTSVFTAYAASGSPAIYYMAIGW